MRTQWRVGGGFLAALPHRLASRRGRGARDEKARRSGKVMRHGGVGSRDAFFSRAPSARMLRQTNPLATLVDKAMQTGVAQKAIHARGLKGVNIATK
jgi:hypothetical protein